MLRDWGFDVFDDIFDHSYDTVENSERVNKLLNDNKSILSNGLQLTDNIKSRLINNRNYYFTELATKLPDLS